MYNRVIHNSVRLEPLFSNLSIPCPRGPKAAFRGNKPRTLGRNFIARLRCLNWCCPACIEHKKQFWGDVIHHGLQTLPDKWHVANCETSQWKRMVRVLSDNRSKFAKLVYDDRMLVVADMPIDGSKLVAVPEAWQSVVDFLHTMMPDRYMKGFREPLETHKRSVSVTRGVSKIQAEARGIEPWEGWPKPETKELAKSKFEFLGIVKKDLAEIQTVLDRWELERQFWHDLPPNIQWAIEWAVSSDMKPEDIAQLWYELGLRPRSGESMDGMIARLDGIWDCRMVA